MKIGNQLTEVADVGNSAKENSVTHIKECMELQKARKNRVVVTPYRQCRRNDPHMMTLPQLTEKRTLTNHKPLQQRTNSTKNKITP